MEADDSGVPQVSRDTGRDVKKLGNKDTFYCHVAITVPSVARKNPSAFFAFPRHRKIVTPSSTYCNNQLYTFIMPTSRIGALNVDSRCVCVSVRQSICPVPDPKSRTKRYSKLKIGRKEPHDTDNP